MKLYHLSLAVTAFLSGAAAQGLDGLPLCAQGCATSAIPSSCGIDPKCICSSKTFITDIACCVANKCSKAEQDSTIEFANQICAGVGVTDLPQTASCASGASSTSSPTSTGSSATTTGASANSTASTTGTESETSDSAASSASNTAASATTTGSASSTSSAASESTSTGAAALVAQNKDAALAAAGALAAFVLLA